MLEMQGLVVNSVAILIGGGLILFFLKGIKNSKVRSLFRSVPNWRSRSYVPLHIQQAMEQARQASLVLAEQELQAWKEEELWHGVDTFVDSQFDYINNLCNGVAGGLQRLLGKDIKFLQRFLRQDIERHILSPEIANKKINNIANKALWKYLQVFDDEIESVAVKSQLSDIKECLPDLCDLAFVYQGNKNIDSYGYLKGKGLLDVGIAAPMIAGKLAFAHFFNMLFGFYFPLILPVGIVLGDFIMHQIKKEGGKKILREKIRSCLNEVLERV